MKQLFLSLSVVLLLAAGNGMAQDPVLKFGQVPVETFTSQPWLADSTASAVILFDKGSSFFRDASGGFEVVYERHTRIHLINKNSFHLATMVLSMYKKGSRSVTLDHFKGATYNLENGKVVSTKVDKSNIFKEQNGDFIVTKIVFPQVSEGSVIEYSYTLVYPGYGLIPSWSFQGDFPVLWSEYEATIPPLFSYIIERHGYLRYTIDTTLVSASNDNRWRGNTTHHIWIMQNVPALVKREPFTTTLANHLNRLDFQLATVQTQPGSRKTYTSNWDELVSELMKNSLFGAPLSDNNKWMDDALEKITGANKTSPQAARNVYYYVRDHFNCTGVEGIYSSQPLKNTWDDKKGNVADINLLLTALYLHLGFEAAPVILSSRAHGLVYDPYPLLRDYNYTIARVKAGDRYYLLDATKDIMPFGQLPELCYNGSARVIDASHNLLVLSPDHVTEKRNTVVVLRNSDTAGWLGSFYHKAGLNESLELRARLKRMKTDDFFGAVRNTMPPYKTMQESGIDSLDSPEALLAWHYNMKYNFKGATVYFNPVLHERTQVNPFTSPERFYPVEMPYCIDYTYSLNMEIPKGYQLDGAPKPERILLDDGNMGFFEYQVQVTGKDIQFSYHFVLKKTNIPVNDYPELRDFYTRIVNKQKEEFIFKKIK